MSPIDKLIHECPLRYNEHQNAAFRKEELKNFAKRILKEGFTLQEAGMSEEDILQHLGLTTPHSETKSAQ